ncbi:MAG: malate synthase G [Nanoarchaeota archaeon]
MSAEYVAVAGGKLNVQRPLYDLLTEMAPGVGLDPEDVWQSLWGINEQLGPRNRELLDFRDTLQARIDQHHRENKDKPFNTLAELQKYAQLLRDIGYVAPPASDDYRVSTSGLDKEILTPGAEGVHPGDKERLVTRGFNGRWESLYVALEGSNMIAEDLGATRGGSYNETRGSHVIAWSKKWLDTYFPLAGASHAHVKEYKLAEADGKTELVARLIDETKTGLVDPTQYAGHNIYAGDDQISNGQLSNVLLKRNGLHIDIEIGRSHNVGRIDSAGVKDISVEAELTGIFDLEDAVAVVNGRDKAHILRNWYKLNLGTLTATFVNNQGVEETRGLNDNRQYISPDGKPLVLSGRALYTMRTVGIHRLTDMVLTEDGQEIPEAYIDTLLGAIAAKHNIDGHGKWMNSQHGKMYVVVPKTHGPDEVAERVKLHHLVEKSVGFEEGTILFQLMVEEQRTSVNLDQCVEAAQESLYAVNSGFLDFTGDNIHTIMYRGAVPPKAEIRASSWLNEGYEANTTNVAIKRGVPMNGKGMYTAIRKMWELYQEKRNQILQGATSGWVPNPIAAVLYSLQFFEHDALAIQRELAGREPVSLEDLLSFPLLDKKLSREEILRELDRNTHAILAYVNPWVVRGVGCSGVKNIDNEEFMEDLATERISSQIIANHELHGLIDREDTKNSMQRMAARVDEQHADDEEPYNNMAPGFNSEAFLASERLPSNGLERLNGYVEGELTPARLRVIKMENAVK